MTPGRRVSARSRNGSSVNKTCIKAQAEPFNLKSVEPSRHKPTIEPKLKENKHFRSIAKRIIDYNITKINEYKTGKEKPLKQMKNTKKRSNQRDNKIQEKNSSTKNIHVKKESTSAESVVLDPPTQPCCGSTVAKDSNHYQSLNGLNQLGKTSEIPYQSKFEERKVTYCFDHLGNEPGNAQSKDSNHYQSLNGLNQLGKTSENPCQSKFDERKVAHCFNYLGNEPKNTHTSEKIEPARQKYTSTYMIAAVSDSPTLTRDASTENESTQNSFENLELFRTGGNGNDYEKDQSLQKSLNDPVTEADLNGLNDLEKISGRRNPSESNENSSQYISNHLRDKLRNTENTRNSSSISNSEESMNTSIESNSTGKNTNSTEEDINETIDPFKYFTEEFHTVMYSNIDQSLTGKMAELLGIIDTKKPSIIMLTEIEPKSKKDPTKEIKESEISIPNYSLFTNKNRKRGVAIYIANTLNPRECTQSINEKFEECVFCEFEGINDEKILVGCMYKSPNSTKENVENMIKTIKNENISKYDMICITGDFNYPKINWEGGTNYGENEIFCESLKDAYLLQKVTKPTRNVRIDQRANIVDLVLTNDENLISEIVHGPPIGASDHDVLYFQLNVTKEKKIDNKTKRFNLAKGNYHKIREHMRKVDWEKMDALDLEHQWNFIKDELLKTMNDNIPKSSTKDIKSVRPCWMNNKVLRKIKKKYHAYKRYLITKEGKEYEDYIRIRNECTRAVKRAKKKHEKNIAKDTKENPTKFWKYVNEKCKTNVGISSLKDENGDLVTTDEGKAELLNNFFTSVFLKEDLTNLPETEEGQYSGKMIEEINITKESVEKKLKQLNPQKAQGPDQIPPRVLKEVSKEIAVPLTKLFKKSIEEGQIPKDWKFAEVTAIFKKGNRTDPGNYRPVSLTSICCKILEQFVRDKIVDHMTENDLYSECQHGFRKNRSCITQLIEVYDKLTELIDDGKSIDIVYLDFKKAFDSIPHERLLIKMKGYGITGNVLNWVRSFLSGRKQRVRVGNSYSNKTNVTSGIPQGSILGPVLFTIFINDLPEMININCQVFADDTKIYDDSSNSMKIQEDLFNMQKWTEKWNLYFNVAKCKVMHVGKKNPQYEYYMKLEGENQKIGTCEEEKDLGIIFDKNLNFDNHITSITKKANQMLGIIRRTFTFIDKGIFSKLYKALVRSHLEYGNVIWNPHLKRQSVMIERVQRRATKLVPECRDMSYIERLKYLKLYSLKGRRLRGDLIQAYKIFQGHDQVKYDKMFSLTTYHGTRNQGLKIRKRFSRTDIRKYTFSNRIVEHWNTLPLEVKQSPSTNAFKNRIDRIPRLVEKFLEFDE